LWCAEERSSVTPLVEWRRRAIRSVTFIRAAGRLAGVGPLGDLDLKLFALV